MNAIVGRGRLTDQVYEHIKAQLLDGRYQPAEVIPIDSLAASLKVSRQPIMDAMRRLDTEGLVSIVPQVGSLARKYDMREISDYYRLFAETDALMAEFAAARATAEDIFEMRSISNQIGGLLASDYKDAERDRKYRLLNRRLHSTIRRAARSEVASTVAERLCDRIYYFAAGTGKPVFAQRLTEAHQEHEELITAIEKRNVKRARKLLLAHTMALEDSVAHNIKMPL